MKVKTLHPKLLEYLKKHKLQDKFQKQLKILQYNPKHPSLHTEILEPRHLKIYSFRLDKKYRAIFVIKNEEIVIIDINPHYQ